MKRWRAMQALVSTALTGRPVGSLDGGEPKPKRHEHVEREGDGNSDGESGASRWTRYSSGLQKKRDCGRRTAYQFSPDLINHHEYPLLLSTKTGKQKTLR